MRVASLFSGVGTFDYGFQMAGWESVHLCEWDPKAREVLAHRFPGVPLTDNVLTLSGAEMTPADCVMFGSPCQDLSVAGKGAGLNVENYAAYKTASAEARRMKDADPFTLTDRERLWLDEFESNRTRSGLFFEAIRIIEEMREATDDLYPRFALWENVPGAFSSNGGRDFAAVVQSFLHIGARDVSWRVLDSRYFGVPQRRRRIFLVADFGGEAAQEVLSEPKGLRGHPQPRPAARQDVAACLTTGTGKRYDAETETLIPVAEPIAFSATQEGGSGGDLVTAPLSASEGGNNMPCVLLPIAFDCLTSFASASNDIAPTLLAGSATEGGRGRAAIALPIAFDRTASASRDPMCGPVSPTLEAQDKMAVLSFQQNSMEGKGTLGVDLDTQVLRPVKPQADHQMLAAPPQYAVRRLTPVEVERLQAMPDGWTDVAGMADSHRYRFMGNGGTSTVLKWLAERMARVLA